MTILTDKQETMSRPISFAGKATHRAGLTRVVCIHLDSHGASQGSFIGKHALQLGKGPIRGMSIGTSLPLTGLLASSTVGTLTDVCQVLQSNDTVMVLVNNAPGNLTAVRIVFIGQMYQVSQNLSIFYIL